MYQKSPILSIKEPHMTPKIDLLTYLLRSMGASLLQIFSSILGVI